MSAITRHPSGSVLNESAVIECQGHPPYAWEQVEVVSLSHDEQMGTKDKGWTRFGGEDWLFKKATSDHAFIRGEDWAEGLVHVIARLLDIPSACIALATHNGDRGLLSRKFVSAQQALLHGNELLSLLMPHDYDSTINRAQRNPHYTLKNIARALGEVKGPAPYAQLPAMDVFAGYLMLDALVAGTDRHHANWAVVKEPSSELSLAPTFDHGNAFGYNIHPSKVHSYLTNSDQFDSFLRRGKCRYFPDRPNLVELAKQGLGMASLESRRYWLEQLRKLDLSEIAQAAQTMPEAVLSEPRRRLALKIVQGNRRRLLNALAVG